MFNNLNYHLSLIKFKKVQPIKAYLIKFPY